MLPTTTNLSQSTASQHTNHYKLPDTAEGNEDLTCMCNMHCGRPLLADHQKDLLTPTVYWPMVESSLGIVGACLPLLRPIFTDKPAKNIFSSLRAMMSRSSLRSDSANTESLEFAKLEAGDFRAPQIHKFKGGQVL